MVQTASVAENTTAGERVAQALARIEEALAGRRLGYETTIEDYPISFKARGRCRLSIEVVPNKGVRTVRETTDRAGRWCAPKKSTYRDKHDTHVFVLHEGDGVRAGWAFLSYIYGFYVTAANGDVVGQVVRPFPSPPRLRGVIYTVGDERRVLEASPPDELRAWDEWTRGLLALATRVAKAIKYHGGDFSAA